MAFPTGREPADAWIQVRREAASLKETLEQRNATMAAGDVSSQFILDILNRLKASVAGFNEAAAVPGIVEYAQNQLQDPTRDIVGEFNAMITACDSAIAYIIANIPKDANDTLLIRTMDAQGNISDILVDSVTTTPLRAELDAVIATIE